MLVSNKLVDTKDNLQGVNFGLDNSNIGLLFEMLRKRLYTKPFEAMVRELASNCLDSYPGGHGTVYITINLEEDILFNKHRYIEFTDHGVGMSPETITNVYCKYLSSTKRDDNSNIGGFGLGAKTPFAVTDEFTVMTTWEGIRYTYLAFIDDTGLGKISLITSEKSDSAGTTVRVPYQGSARAILDVMLQTLRLVNCDIAVLGEYNRFNMESVIESEVAPNKWHVCSNIGYFKHEHLRLIHSINRFDGVICIGDTLTYDLSTINKYALSDKAKIGFIMVMDGLAFNVDIGELELPPNRETITANAKNTAVIDKKLCDMVDIVSELIMKDYNKLPSHVTEALGSISYSIYRAAAILKWFPSFLNAFNIHSKTNGYIVSNSTLLWKLLSALNIGQVNDRNIMVYNSVHSMHERMKGKNLDVNYANMLFVQADKTDNAISVSQVMVATGNTCIITFNNKPELPTLAYINDNIEEFRVPGYLAKSEEPKEVVVKNIVRSARTPAKENKFECIYKASNANSPILPYIEESTVFSRYGTIDITYENIKKCVNYWKLFTSKAETAEADYFNSVLQVYRAEAVIWVLDENICKRLERDLKITRFTRQSDMTCWVDMLKSTYSVIKELQHMHKSNLLIYSKLLKDKYDVNIEAVIIAKIMAQLSTNTWIFNTLVSDRKYHGVDIEDLTAYINMYIKGNTHVYTKGGVLTGKRDHYNSFDLIDAVTAHYSRNLTDMKVLTELLITLDR